MSATTIKLSSEVRDRLSEVAQRDFDGSTLGEAVGRLLAEHDRARIEREILDGYARLQADPDAWTDYLGEVEEWAELGAEMMRRGAE